MQKMVCSTCKHYKALEIPGWGSCQLEDLWPVRSQEVLADSLACLNQGSRWEAMQVENGNRHSNQNIINPEISTSMDSTRSRPGLANWLIGIGIIGILFSPFVYVFLDIAGGIPIFPDLTIIWLIFSLALIVVGVIWRKK